MTRSNTIPARIMGLLAVSDGLWTRREIAAALDLTYSAVNNATQHMKVSSDRAQRKAVETRIAPAANDGGRGKPKRKSPAKIAKKAEPPIAAPDYRPACVPAPKLKLDLDAAFRAMERKPEPDWRWDWQRQRPPTQTGLGRAGDVP